MIKSSVFLLLVFLLAFLPSSYGQSPYQIKWKYEGLYMAGGLGSMAYGSYLSSRVNHLSTEEITALNRNSIMAFDRPATFNNSYSATDASNRLLRLSNFFPLVLLSGKKMRSHLGHIGLLYVETTLLVTGITKLAKRSILRNRPYVYNDAVDLASKQNRNARYSFFSGHTATTAANCFFTAKIINDFYPDFKLKPLVWGLAAAIPAITAYYRVAAGAHYPSDVIMGYAVGASLGFFVPHIHKIRKKKKERSQEDGKSFTMQSTGMGVRMAWVF